MIRFLLLFLCISLWAKEKPSTKWQASIQPRFSFEPNGPLSQRDDSAKVKQDLAQAKFSLKIKVTENQPFGVNASIDLAKNNILRNAFVFIKPTSWIKVNIGRYKVPFGLDFQRSSKDLSLHGKTKTTNDIKDLLGESRHNGFGINLKLPFNIASSFHSFQSPNIAIDGLELFQLMSSNIEYSPYKNILLGTSWMSELLKRNYEQRYQSHYWSTFALLTPQNWRLEVEAVWMDTKTHEFTSAIGNKDTTLHRSIRAMLEYKCKLPTLFDISPLVQVERITTRTYNKNLLRNGIRFDYKGPKKSSSKFAFSLNNSFSYNEQSEDWNWHNAMLLFHYSFRKKG